MPMEQEQRAAQVVNAARRGDLGEAGRDLVALFTAAVERGAGEQRKADRLKIRGDELEREVNALAAVLADLLDGGPITQVNELPHDARRRVLAFRHQSLGGLFGMAAPIDQFGPLPKVPPRASVMRESVRTIDV